MHLKGPWSAARIDAFLRASIIPMRLAAVAAIPLVWLMRDSPR
jgi:hypothetical protein